MLNCKFCGKPLDGYGEYFFEISLNKNYQSQGYPATFTDKKIAKNV